MGKQYITGYKGISFADKEARQKVKTVEENQIELVEDELSMEGISDITYDTLQTTNKTLIGGVNEVNSQLKDIAKQIESGNIGNNVEPALMDMPRIYFSEGTLPTTKTATMMRFDYYSKTAEYHGWAEIKCQGNSSMSYPKKNFTIKLYKDKAKTEKLKIDFKGWGKQSKFVLKANWIDITHARNVVSARIWGDIVKSRSGYANLPELLRTSPNQGAIDGFPITVYGNGYYQGRYTLNIPKDKWMSNMDDTLDAHCILCGENYVSGCFRALPQINETDWTDELHDTVPATIKNSWTNAINFVMTSSDSEFKTNLSNYFDVNSLIDYYLYGLISTNLDGFGKNQLFFCYDGIHWIASVYDLDSTWGLYWNGSKILATDYARNQYEDKISGRQGNLLYIRLEQLFISELKARYTELRKEVLSASHIIQKFEEFNQICPKDILQEDYASTTGGGSFTTIPSTSTNNIQQIRSNIVSRLTYVDSYIDALQEEIPCTNITLNNTILSFTTTDTQTLIPTLTPTDTTDAIIWSVSPSGIVTVKDGVVTPIANGNCVITAKCGEKTATCNVTVSGITTQYTITNNLTNCSNSNSSTSIEENSPYSATITAKVGYTLGTPIITMGENDITSTSYTDGVITIGNVTGNIVITCTATKEFVPANIPADAVMYLDNNNVINGVVKDNSGNNNDMTIVNDNQIDYSDGIVFNSTNYLKLDSPNNFTFNSGNLSFVAKLKTSTLTVVPYILFHCGTWSSTAIFITLRRVSNTQLTLAIENNINKNKEITIDNIDTTENHIYGLRLTDGLLEVFVDGVKYEGNSQIDATRIDSTSTCYSFIESGTRNASQATLYTMMMWCKSLTDSEMLSLTTN